MLKRENNNIILPVISFEINYKKPARYYEFITLKTIIKEMPKVLIFINLNIIAQFVFIKDYLVFIIQE